MFQFFQAIRLLCKDNRGNVFVLFGAAAIPLMLILGGALDFARYTRYRTDLANAVDAASLALARKHPDFDADHAKAFITEYVNAIVIGDDKFGVQSYDVQKMDKGFQVTATGSMQTIFCRWGRFAKNGRDRLDGRERHGAGGQLIRPARAGACHGQHRVDELRSERVHELCRRLECARFLKPHLGGEGSGKIAG